MTEATHRQRARLLDRALTDLLSFIVDNRGRTCPVTDHGFPLIATNCIKPDQREAVFENVRYVDDETYAHWFRAHPLPGDVIFVCKGSPGRVAVVPDPVPYCIAQDMVALRADANVIDPKYLYYRLSAPDVQAKIQNMHVGTLIPHFKKGDFSQLRFSVHEDLDEQRRIAHVLGTLDDLIENLEATCSQLDQLQRAIFRSRWDGSTRVPVSELGSITMGQSPPGETYNEHGDGLPFYQGVRDFGLRHPAQRVYCTSPTRLAHESDVLIAVRAPVGDTNVAIEDCAIGRGLAALASNRPSTALQALQCDSALWSKFQGDGTVFAAVSKQTLAANQVPWVDDRRLELTLAPMDELYRACWDEANKLRGRRDELLPLLLSGRVRIEDVTP